MLFDAQSFRDLDADGRRKRVAELIRDLYPHRQSEKAAEIIESLYAPLFETVGEAENAEAPMPTPHHVRLEDLQREIYEINVANGWFEEDRTFDDDIALLHSEVSEMLEAYRDHGIEDVTEDLSMRFDSRDMEGQPKPEGFGSEAADVVVRALDTAQRRGITIPWRSLSDIPPSDLYEGGKTIGRHITVLHWLISKIDDEFPDLVPTLSYLTTVCRHLEIDLNFELTRKVSYNRTRGYRHGGKRV